MTWRPMKIKKIFIGRRPARENPRNQGGGRAKRHSCQALNDIVGGKTSRPLKFGGLVREPGACCRNSSFDGHKLINLSVAKVNGHARACRRC